MSLWRETFLNLRHAVPKTVPGDRACRAQSKRLLTYSSQSPRVTAPNQYSLYAKRPGYSVSQRRAWNGLNPQCRSFSATAGVQHGHITPPKPGEELNISFIDKDGEKYDFQVSEGDNLLDIAQANDLEMEGSDPLGTGHNAQACLLTGFLCARSLRRFMRLLDMPCHRGGPRRVRQDGRTIRRRKRHAGFGIRTDRDISAGLSSYHEQGA
ncbi:hypothetical protein BDV24DRAFT_90657 [Aspergillus arachidicola]|uniref:Uncharacterized protein n=1 Tax=Aspergillus arachidicola TaxID=656916 RepID=A0A5N6YKR9_9EURO|nr:hypothetical protein BDV24DRAFT_90657 [Aspergillus arachidicola]